MLTSGGAALARRSSLPELPREDLLAHVSGLGVVCVDSGEHLRDDGLQVILPRHPQPCRRVHVVGGAEHLQRRPSERCFLSDALPQQARCAVLTLPRLRSLLYLTTVASRPHASQELCALLWQEKEEKGWEPCSHG